MTHSTSRIIIAPPHLIFRAHLDARLLAQWRAPADMSLRIESFNPRVGGAYRLALIYADPAAASPKSTADSDIAIGRFIEIEPDERIVEAIRFDTSDPAFAGEMVMTTTLIRVAGGTKIMIRADQVPVGISEADHRAGMDGALKRLAMLVE